LPPRPGLSLALAAALAACSPAAPTVIDGSSPQRFEETVAQARADLPAADRLDFDRALAGVPARRYADRDPDARRRTTFGGQTAAQVVEDYRRRAR
jgi:hypothetical protein